MSAATDLVRARAEFAAALQARRPAIEEAVRVRIYAIADPIEAADPEYAEGLRLAVSAALDYGFAAIGQSEEHLSQIPTTLLAQARLAARNGVPLDTVLRRYFAGYTLLGDFLVEEAESIEGGELKRLLRTQAAIFDRLIVAVTEEYGREQKARHSSPEQRRAARVKRLLDGEPIDTAELVYELDAWHVGVVAAGANVETALCSLAKATDRSLLLVRPAEESVWAWLGGRRPIPMAEILKHTSTVWAGDASVAFGEPAQSLAGWRFTHRQAMAALEIARSGAEPVVRYAEVGLLASILQDEVLVAFLYQQYLAPFAEAPDGGETLRKTLRAYLAVEGNISSAAIALGVNRRTVTYRIRAVESLLDCAVSAATPEIEAALLLWDFDHANRRHERCAV